MIEQHIQDVVRQAVNSDNPAMPDRWFREGYYWCMAEQFKQEFGIGIAVDPHSGILSLEESLRFSINGDLPFDDIRQAFVDRLMVLDITIEEARDVVYWKPLTRNLLYDKELQCFFGYRDISLQVLLDFLLCLIEHRHTTWYGDAAELLKTCEQVKQRPVTYRFPTLHNLEIAVFVSGKMIIAHVSDEVLAEMHRIMALLDKVR